MAKLSSDSPPRTVRRRSLQASVRDVAEASRSTGLVISIPSSSMSVETTAEISRDVLSKLEKPFSNIQDAFSQKFAAATDMTEVVSALKSAALRLYTASEVICELNCGSAHVLMSRYHFVIGVQSLLTRIWERLHPDDISPFIATLTDRYMSELRESTDSPFSADSVDAYIDDIVSKLNLLVEQKKKTASQLPFPTSSSLSNDIEEWSKSLLSVGPPGSILAATEKAAKLEELIKNKVADIRRLRASGQFTQDI